MGAAEIWATLAKVWATLGVPQSSGVLWNGESAAPYTAEDSRSLAEDTHRPTLAHHYCAPGERHTFE